MRKKFTGVFAMLLISVIMLFAQPGFNIHVNAAENSDLDMDYLKGIMDMIKEKYRGQITDEQLIEGALKGMFNTMDPYTTYYTPEEANSFLSDMGGTYEGIGVMMEKINDYIVVAKVFQSSPAEKAGIIQGDIIVEVDGTSIVGASTDEAGSLIRGTAGTKVILGVIREGNKDIIRIEVTRSKVKINPVSYYIKDDIGYIKLDIFNANTNEFITKALNDMDSNNISKIILDLRNNPGGEVTQAVAVARKLVPEGLITKLDFKSQSMVDVEYYSYLKSPQYKLAVLVNGMSASASEILAGAIQDTGSGKLIGTKTFGKAKVQNLIPILTSDASQKYKDQLGVKLVDGFDLVSVYGIYPKDDEIMGWTKITTGVYYTPKNRMIDEKGLEPDIEIEDTSLVNGIDIRNIQTLTATSKPALNSENLEVYHAEMILKLLGYDVNSPDTKLDEKTFNAIKKFQKDSGLYPYGVMDFTTQKVLNRELDNMILKVDKQYTKAIEVLNGM